MSKADKFIIWLATKYPIVYIKYFNEFVEDSKVDTKKLETSGLGDKK